MEQDDDDESEEQGEEEEEDEDEDEDDEEDDEEEDLKAPQPSKRRPSAPKMARDLLPTGTVGDEIPKTYSVFNTLILSDDPMDGTRSLRKRKASEISEAARSVRKRQQASCCVSKRVQSPPLQVLSYRRVTAVGDDPEISAAMAARSAGLWIDMSVLSHDIVNTARMLCIQPM